MNPRLLIIALFLLICSGACRRKASSPELLVYIMAGQSNMAGRGQIAPEDTVTDSRILTINAAKEMVVAKEPLHFYHPGFEGLDCGVSFARELLIHAPSGTRVCLVPAAMSSTSVEEWLGDSLRGHRLFSNAVSRAEAAREQGGRIAGVLWHQGESNAESAARSKRYGQTLDSLTANFRSKLQTPLLPVFAATLADFCERPYKDSINAAIGRLAKADPRFVMVDAHDLSGRGDGVHFDARAQRELGRRFAIAAAAFLR